MPDPRHELDAERPPPLLARVFGAVAAWAKTEVGGWTIIGGLSAVAIVALAALFLTNAASRSEPDPQAAPGPLSEAPALVQGATEINLAPESLQQMSFDAARAWNAKLPFSTERNPVAQGFIASIEDVSSYGRALDCLTTAIYYEAASETPAGQAAVAQVVLNRTRHPAFPRTVCGVVFQGSERTTGCQFSFTCDGALARTPSVEGWARARAVATSALNGVVLSAVGTATHYHTDWVAPYWAPRLTKVVQLGTHIFYRWPGSWGRSGAFTGRYVGGEPIIAKMAPLSTALEEPAPIEILASMPEGEFVAPAVTPGPLLSPLVAADEIASTDPAPAPSIVVPPPSPPPAEAAAARDARRDTTIVRDPLSNPANLPERRPTRLPTPSSRW